MALYQICAEGRIENLELALAEDPNLDLNQTNKEGKTPFYVACEAGQTSIVRFLSELPQVDTAKPDQEGQSPFSAALKNKHVLVCKFLMKQGPNANQTELLPSHIPEPVFPFAFFVCDDKTINSFLQEQPIDYQKLGCTELQVASWQGDLSHVKKLISQEPGYISVPSPLWIAARANHLEIVTFLLQDRHYLSMENETGMERMMKMEMEMSFSRLGDIKFMNNPLVAACEAGHIDIVKLLLESRWRISGLGVEGAKALAAPNALPRLQQLTVLDLRWSKIGAEGAKALAAPTALPQLKQLTSLDLSHNEIGVEGVIALAAPHALSQLKQLTSLNLSHNNIGVEGAKALAAPTALPQLKQLTSLDLIFNWIGAGGAIALFAPNALPQLKQLTALYLGSNNIGDEGAKALAAPTALPHLEQLTELDLSNNYIGDEGVIALAAPDALPHLEQLTELDLSNNQIGAEGATRLKQILTAFYTTSEHHTEFYYELHRKIESAPLQPATEDSGVTAKSQASASNSPAPLHLLFFETSPNDALEIMKNKEFPAGSVFSVRNNYSSNPCSFSFSIKMIRPFELRYGKSETADCLSLLKDDDRFPLISKDPMKPIFYSSDTQQYYTSVPFVKAEFSISLSTDVFFSVRDDDISASFHDTFESQRDLLLQISVSRALGSRLQLPSFYRHIQSIIDWLGDQPEVFTVQYDGKFIVKYDDHSLEAKKDLFEDHIPTGREIEFVFVENGRKLNTFTPLSKGFGVTKQNTFTGNVLADDNDGNKCLVTVAHTFGFSSTGDGQTATSPDTLVFLNEVDQAPCLLGTLKRHALCSQADAALVKISEEMCNYLQFDPRPYPYRQDEESLLNSVTQQVKMESAEQKLTLYGTSSIFPERQKFMDSTEREDCWTGHWVTWKDKKPVAGDCGASLVTCASSDASPPRLLGILRGSNPEEKSCFTSFEKLGPLLQIGRPRSFKGLKPDYYELKCPVCLEQKRDIVLSCGHCFCKGCIHQLVTPECPNCRAPIQHAWNLYL